MFEKYIFLVPCLSFFLFFFFTNVAEQKQRCELPIRNDSLTNARVRCASCNDVSVPWPTSKFSPGKFRPRYSIIKPLERRLSGRLASRVIIRDGLCRSISYKIIGRDTNSLQTDIQLERQPLCHDFVVRDRSATYPSLLLFYFFFFPLPLKSRPRTLALSPCKHTSRERKRERGRKRPPCDTIEVTSIDYVKVKPGSRFVV